MDSYQLCNSVDSGMIYTPRTWKLRRACCPITYKTLPFVSEGTLKKQIKTLPVAKTLPLINITC